MYHPEETDTVLADRVVAATDAAHTGAAFLDLIDDQPTGVSLTALGAEVVRFGIDRYGSVDAALDAFAEWHRTRSRFYDEAPEWGLLTRRIVWAYPATKLLVESLQAMHAEGITAPSLVDLVAWLHEGYPTFTVELFLRGTDDVRSRVLNKDGELRMSELTDGRCYHSPTVFQLKTMLYHAGLLTERGAEPSPRSNVRQVAASASTRLAFRTSVTVSPVIALNARVE